MPPAILAHHPFITDQKCLAAWARHWRPDPRVHLEVPEGAVFSLIPIDELARKVVLDNADHASIIRDSSGQKLIGLPAMRRPGTRHGILLTMGRAPGNTIKIRDIPEISTYHAMFELNMASGIPLVRDTSSKSYTRVAAESSDGTGRARIATSPHPLTKDTRKAVLLPHLNTIVHFGKPDRVQCIWRTYWHETEWPLERPEFLVPMKKTLAPTQSFGEEPEIVTERLELGYDPGSPKKTQLRLGDLGKGDYGSVHKAVNMANGDLIAVKVQLDKDKIRAEAKARGKNEAWVVAEKASMKKAFEAEIKAYSRLKHKNIIRMHGWWQFQRRVELYLDLKDGTAEFLKKPGVVHASRKRGVAFDLMKDIASALVAVHAHDFVHRDVWPENILYEKNPIPLSGCKFFLGDLGHCRHRSKPIAHDTQWNVAPELWSPSSPSNVHDERSDIWSLFVTVVDMIYPRHFDGVTTKNGADIVERVQRARKTFPEMQDFYDMASMDPERRPSAKQVVALTQEYGARDRFCGRATPIWRNPP